MHGISAVSGSRTSTLTVCGRTYTLTAGRLRQFGEKEDYILRLRQQRGAEADRKSKTWAHVTFEEEQAFDNSTRGILFRFWSALKPNHPEFQTENIEEGIQRAADLFEELIRSKGKDAFEMLSEAMDQAEQKDIAKNSNGPGEKETPTKSMTENTGSPGPESTKD